MLLYIYKKKRQFLETRMLRSLTYFYIHIRAMDETMEIGRNCGCEYHIREGGTRPDK